MITLGILLGLVGTVFSAIGGIIKHKEDEAKQEKMIEDKVRKFMKD